MSARTWLRMTSDCRNKRSPGTSYLLATRSVEEKAACRRSHSTDHIFLTVQWGQRHLLSLSGRTVGPWIHTENMKVVTSGGLGPHPRLIFTTLWQSFSGVHMGAVRANPQRIGDDRLDTSTSLPASSYWSIQSNWSLMPSNLEMKNQTVFSP